MIWTTFAILAINIGSGHNGPTTTDLHGPPKIHQTAASGGHTYSVRIEQGAFAAGRGTLGRIPTGFGAYYPALSGRRLYGEEGWTPKELSAIVYPRLQSYGQIKRFSVTIDNKTIVVPSRLFNDLLEPHFERDHPLGLIPTSDGVLIVIDGSDGTGAYQATLRVRRDGRVTRNIELLD
jgi:hypothetical protein